MSIPRSLIRKMAADDAVYTNGLSLSHTDFSYKITPTAFAGLFQITAEFSEEKASVRLEIDNENEWIETMACSCEPFTAAKTPCRHIVALLLKIENEFFSAEFSHRSMLQKPELKTDSDCLTLLEERARLLKARALQRASFEKALVSPLISISSEGIFLGIKAGCKRTYVVRDLEVFYSLIKNREIAPCGRSSHFLYAPEHFYDSALIDFFMAYYPLCRTEKSRKTVLLSPEALDRFFALFKNRKIPADNGLLSLKEDIPPFKLFIRRSADFYRLSLSRRDFDILKGQEQIYIKIEDVIYLCGAAFSDACGSLLGRFSRTASDPIISAADMSTFYSLVIKPAAEYFSVEATEKSFIPSRLKTKIFLDAVGKTVVARTEFHYDNAFYYAFSPDRDLLTVYDIEGEAKIENLIKLYFSEPGSEPGTAVLTADDDSLFVLLYEGIPELSRHAVLYVSADLKKIRLKPFSSPSAAVRAESGLLQLEVTADTLPAAVLAAALSAYRQKKRYLRLKNGSFLLLETEAMHRLSRLADSAGFSAADLKKPVIELPLYRALYLDSVTDFQIAKDSSFTRLTDAFSVLSASKEVPPDIFSGKLRGYQEFGFRWLMALSHCGFGGILADDMGLGKTIQILALLSAHKQQNGTLKALVVCPSSLVLNWENELHRFTTGLQSACIIGSAEERAAQLKNASEYEVLITSYDLLKRDIPHYGSLTFDFEIVDEAQYIKNHNTQNARSVKLISARNRFALTGTPIENSLAELWSIFDYLMPGYLYRYARFRQRFETPVIREGDTSALQELKKMTAPFILRRLKREVLKELPPKTETILYTQLAPEQEKLYAGNLAVMRSELQQEFSQTSIGQSKLIALAMLMRLRQICCDPGLVYENYKEESAKFDLCMNLVKTSAASGHKILIFSQFTSMLALLGNRLKQEEIPYYLIEGATGKEERLAQVSAFNRDDTPVFLISLKAGGTGLNLTGADTVIHYDPWWNLSAQNQATDRAYRIGQKNSVSVYKLITKNTIEEKILKLAEKKQGLAERVLPDENHILKEMTREQILDLFQS